MNMKSFTKVALVLSVSSSLFINSALAEDIKVYAPKTDNLNVIDTIALHTYCTLSKLLGGERERCFSSIPLDTNSNNSSATDTVTMADVKQNIEISLSSINEALARDRRDIEILLNRATSSEGTKSNVVTERTQTIVKYIVGDTTPGPRGADGVPGKTIVNSYQNTNGGLTFVYNDNTTFSTPPLVGLSTSTVTSVIYATSSAPASTNVFGLNSSAPAAGSISIGNNITNNLTGSVAIGNNNYTKMFIGSDGFVSIGGSSTTTGSLIGLTDDNGQPVTGEEKLRVSGHIVARGFVANAGADLAELFPSDESNLVPGDIVMFSSVEHEWNTGGSEKDNYNILGVVKANSSDKAIGVIATNPGLTLGGNTKNGVPVAFAGRIPVKVSSENGKIEKGDRITLSGKYGVGAKLIGNGYSIGIALSSDNGKGTVLMLVKNEKVSK